MKTLQMTAILAIGLGLSFTTAKAENEPEAPAPVAFTNIALNSSGGFTGRGDGTALTVGDDSTLVVSINDKKTERKLEAVELEKLKKLVAAVDWKNVKDFYNVGADQFASVLKVTIDGTEWETSVTEMPPADVPKELQALLVFLKGLQKIKKS